MSLVEQTLKDLRRHEGCRLKPYMDTEKIWTIGYGHTGPGVHKNMAPITLEQAEKWLLEDYYHAIFVLKRIYPDYDNLDIVRKGVLINMAFNLGYRLRGFKKMLAALETRDYSSASLEMLSSLWATQVKGRATELAQRMATGKIPAHLTYAGVVRGSKD